MGLLFFIIYIKFELNNDGPICEFIRKRERENVGRCRASVGLPRKDGERREKEGPKQKRNVSRAPGRMHPLPSERAHIFLILDY